MDMQRDTSRAVFFARSGLIVAMLLLAACASDQSAPVEDRSIRSQYADNDAANPPPAATHPSVGGTYRVQSGDTLYAIAFKHGIDFRDLAGWNRIPAPYRIYVGQELKLSAPLSVASAGTTPAGVTTAPVQERPIATTVTPLSPQTQSAHPTNNPPPPKPAASSPMFENVEPESTPSQAPAAVVTSAPPPKVVAQSASPKPPVVAETETPKPVEPAPQLNAGGVSWHWPAAGNVIGTYVSGDQTKQGVDIAGNEGDPITATADGEVVYSGNGLIGYGELIIIKHNASFLSAYGHNRKRLVQEGDKVKAGQRIAEMGASAAARDELHFEIRKNGKPVNPLEYLPVR